jgi:hypothetical protein
MAESGEEGGAFLLCMRVVGSPKILVPGSTKTRCTDCGEPVWVSPASLKLSKKRKLKTVCMQCADERAAKDDDLHIQAPTEEQRQEIRDFIERG